MFSPKSFTASTPCETAVCACSTTPVATRFTRASGDALRPPPERFAAERFAVDFFAPPRFAAPREAEPRADDFFAEVFLAAPRFAPPFFAALFLADERLAPRLAPPRRAEPLPALRLLPPFFFVAIAASPLPVGGSRCCARSWPCAQDSGAWSRPAILPPRVKQLRSSCERATSSREARDGRHLVSCVSSGTRRRRSRNATPSTWSLASQPASGTTMWVASPMLARRRAATHHWDMPPLNLTQLAIGERVQHELLVVERLEKTQGNGDPFVLLTLGNASGSISVAPIWSNQRAWADGADRGRVVQAIGQVGLYPKTGKRQIHLTGPLRVLPAEQVDLHAFLPRIAGDTNRLWDWIDKRRAEIATPPLRQVVDLFYADDNFRVRLEQTPGSVNGHHAKLGGLLLHVFEVASIARNMAKTMNANADLVVAGALLHDIGKVEAYEIEGGGFGQ